MLPGFRFVCAAIVLSMSVLIFGLGAAQLLRAAHQQFVSLPPLRAAPGAVYARPSEAPMPTLSLLRVEAPAPRPPEPPIPPGSPTAAERGSLAAPEQVSTLTQPAPEPVAPPQAAPPPEAAARPEKAPAPVAEQAPAEHPAIPEAAAAPAPVAAVQEPVVAAATAEAAPSAAEPVPAKSEPTSVAGLAVPAEPTTAVSPAPGEPADAVADKLASLDQTPAMVEPVPLPTAKPVIRKRRVTRRVVKHRRHSARTELARPAIGRAPSNAPFGAPLGG